MRMPSAAEASIAAPVGPGSGRLKETRWPDRPRRLGHAGGFPGRALHPVRKPSRRKPRSEMDKMGYLFGQKRPKVGRLQRQAARCVLVTREADAVELGTGCWPRVMLIEKRPA